MATQPVKPKSVRQLFSDPTRWIKGYEHKEKKINGKVVDCFCLTGAIDHIYEDHQKNAAARKRVRAAIEAYELGKFDLNKYEIEGWNDRRKRTIVDVQRVAAFARI